MQDIKYTDPATVNRRQLCEFVNIVLHDTRPDDVEGPINWGDLSCTDVQLVTSMDGASYITIIIEEASPDGNQELKEHVLKKVSAMYPGLLDVYVETEW